MNHYRLCPYCRSIIHIDSTVCPYCGHTQYSPNNFNNMIYYYYKDELYKLSVYMRQSTFNLLKQSNPNRIVSVRNIETDKEEFVPIKELINYSVHRNLQALKS